MSNIDQVNSLIKKTRSSIGADKSRGKTVGDPDVAEKYQNLHALQLERAVRHALAATPRPTDDQLAHIASLLRAGGGLGGAA